jgi:branched-chain amino acid transport system permease protein
VLDAYVVTILTLMGVWSIVALGLNVITGFAGQFNLGIGVYMGTGAYVSAMLTTETDLGFWQALPCAIAASALMGLLTGLPALRVREDSLAVLTIGFVFVFESLLVYLPYFGGPVGISRIPRASLGGELVSNQLYLLIVIGALALSVAICLFLRRSSSCMRSPLEPVSPAWAGRSMRTSFVTSPPTISGLCLRFTCWSWWCWAASAPCVVPCSAPAS